MGVTETQAEIVAGLHEHQKSILAALDFYDDEANKQKIREFAENFRSAGGIPKGSVYHHFEEVEKADLIEQVGEEKVGRGGTSHVYRLLPLGEAISGEVREDDTITADDVKTLVDRVDEHGETIKSMEKDMTEMKESYDQIQHSLALVKAHLGVEEDEEDDATETVGRV